MPTWASIPVGSSDGRYLAARVGGGTNTLEVFDVATQQAVYRNVFTDTMLDLMVGLWDSGRYTSLSETNLSTGTKRWQKTMLYLDVKQLWRVHMVEERPAKTWLPSENVMLGSRETIAVPLMCSYIRRLVPPHLLGKHRMYPIFGPQVGARLVVI